MRLTSQDHSRVERGRKFNRYSQEFKVSDYCANGWYCEALTDSKFCKKGDAQWFPSNRVAALVRKRQLDVNLGLRND